MDTPESATHKHGREPPTTVTTPLQLQHCAGGDASQHHDVCVMGKMQLTRPSFMAEGHPSVYLRVADVPLVSQHAYPHVPPPPPP